MQPFDCALRSQANLCSEQSIPLAPIKMVVGSPSAPSRNIYFFTIYFFILSEFENAISNTHIYNIL